MLESNTELLQRQNTLWCLFVTSLCVEGGEISLFRREFKREETCSNSDESLFIVVYKRRACQLRYMPCCNEHWTSSAAASMSQYPYRVPGPCTPDGPQSNNWNTWNPYSGDSTIWNAHSGRGHPVVQGPREAHNPASSFWFRV